jgi:hypothetical protein
MTDNYVLIGRDLADALMRYARDRRDDDKKIIASLHRDLCVLRRAELAEEKLNAHDETT